MLRRIIRIHEERCTGCGLCVAACHEGAIGMVDGKAKLLREDHCDGLGDCLPACPAGAISFVERNVLDVDAAAAIQTKQAENASPLLCGCPGGLAKTIQHSAIDPEKIQLMESQLSQWPVQIKLAPVRAAYFEHAHLLVAADCTAYAYGNFHNDFIRNRVTLIGCPKLDHVDYGEKLTEIIQNHTIESIIVVRMEVPCCRGIENAVKTAIQASGMCIPLQVVTISTDGKILTD